MIILNTSLIIPDYLTDYPELRNRLSWITSLIIPDYAGIITGPYAQITSNYVTAEIHISRSSG